IGKPTTSKFLCLVFDKIRALCGFPHKLGENGLQGGSERCIDDAGLTAPQSQDLPHEVGDIGYVHFLDDAARPYLMVESVADALEFVFRLGDEQRRRWQNCSTRRRSIGHREYLLYESGSNITTQKIWPDWSVWLTK